MALEEVGGSLGEGDSSCAWVCVDELLVEIDLRPSKMGDFSRLEADFVGEDANEVAVRAQNVGKRL